MAKRKIAAEQAVEDILRFVENEDNDFEDNNDLAELYDDGDLEAAAAKSDSDSGSGNEHVSDDETEHSRTDRPPTKLLARVRLVNSIDKSLDPACYDKHDFVKNVEMLFVMLTQS